MQIAFSVPCSSIVYYTQSVPLRPTGTPVLGSSGRPSRKGGARQEATCPKSEPTPGGGAAGCRELHEHWLKALQRLRLIVRLGWTGAGTGVIGKGPEKVPVGLKPSCEPRRSGEGAGGQSWSGESVRASWLLEGGGESGGAGMGDGRAVSGAGRCLGEGGGAWQGIRWMSHRERHEVRLKTIYFY